MYRSPVKVPVDFTASGAFAVVQAEATVVYASSEENIDTTIVNGRIAYHKGSFACGLTESALVRKIAAEVESIENEFTYESPAKSTTPAAVTRTLAPDVGETPVRAEETVSYSVSGSRNRKPLSPYVTSWVKTASLASDAIAPRAQGTTGTYAVPSAPVPTVFTP